LFPIVPKSKSHPHIDFNNRICIIVLDNHVEKCRINYTTEMCYSLYKVEAWTSVKPFASLKTFATLERIPMPKVISSLVGCDSNATTESSSIYSPSFYSSLLCILDSDANPNWTCVLLKLKSDITRCGIIHRWSLGATSTTPCLFGRTWMPPR